jgi:Uma2 family endonuclease
VRGYRPAGWGLPLSQAGGTVTHMRVVILDAPEDLIAERHRLGHDRFDEVWEGEYHMVPFPTSEHQRVVYLLSLVLGPLAEGAGLEVRPQFGLYDPEVADHSSYRGPDVVLFRPEHATERGVEGRAELVIEVRSPGDESFAKLGFYERVGVQEFLIVDRDTKALHHWIRRDERLVETEAPVVALHAVPARLQTDGETLVVETPAGTQQI